MAEGLLRHIAGDRFEVFSAGTRPTDFRPEAIRVMDEIGIDISGQRLHWSFQDPAAVQGSDSERLSAFRKIRDEIRARIGNFLKEAGR